MGELILGLATVFAPMIKEIILKHQAANNGIAPTDDEVRAAFEANLQKYLDEGAAWKATHSGA